MLHANCLECSHQSGRTVARVIAGTVLAAALAATAAVLYLLKCRGSGAASLVFITLPAAILAAGALSCIVLPRKTTSCGHGSPAALSGVLDALYGPPAAPGKPPWKSVAHSFATLAVAAVAAAFAFPPTDESVAWRAVLSSSDPEPVYAYAAEWPDRRPRNELAALAWERIRTSNDPARFQRFVDVFPAEDQDPAVREALARTRAEAQRRLDELRKADLDRVAREEQEKLIARIAEEERTVLASGSSEACVDFLKRCPWSGRAGEIREALLRLLEKSWTRESRRLPPAALRAMFAAGASGPVGVFISATTPESCHAPLLKAAEDSLAQFGFTATLSGQDKATIHLEAQLHEEMQNPGADSMGPFFGGPAMQRWAGGKVTIRVPGSSAEAGSVETLETGVPPESAGAGVRRAFAVGEAK